MPSNVFVSVLKTIGTCSNCALTDLRMSSSALSDSKPCTVAAITWSDPRGTVVLPGFTSIRYGLASSTSPAISSSADAPCRR